MAMTEAGKWLAGINISLATLTLACVDTSTAERGGIAGAGGAAGGSPDVGGSGGAVASAGAGPIAAAGTAGTGAAAGTAAADAVGGTAGASAVVGTVGAGAVAGSAAAGAVALGLPRFSFTWGTESLKPALIALDMTDAFEPTIADFSGINSARQLYISDVLHQAFISVDEYGTEAAAATAVIIADASIPPTPVPFTVDRPFLFFIRDSSGLLLFAGQVVDASA
jgi:hypothetical protein